LSFPPSVFFLDPSLSQFSAEVIHLKKDALRSSKMLISSCITTWHHNPQDHDMIYQRCLFLIKHSLNAKVMTYTYIEHHLPPLVTHVTKKRAS